MCQVTLRQLAFVVGGFAYEAKEEDQEEYLSEFEEHDHLRQGRVFVIRHAFRKAKLAAHVVG